MCYRLDQLSQQRAREQERTRQSTQQAASQESPWEKKEPDRTDAEVKEAELEVE